MRSFFPTLCLSMLAISYASAEDGFPTDDSFDRVQKESQVYEQGVQKESASYEARVKKEWEDYQAKVKKEWSDGLIPEQKRFVEYSADLSQRIRVDYESGDVTVDSLQSPDDPDAQSKAKAAITETLKKTSDRDQNEKLPVFGSPSNAPVQVSAPVNEKGTDGIAREKFSYHFKMPEGYLTKRMQAVLPWVKEWAEKNKMDPSLILAVIRQESAFNPKARSWVPAFGLMQIVPSSAGKEVLEKLSGKKLAPDEETLYDPRSNIMFGSTYLKLLGERFQGVKNELNRNYLVICSYNWGPGRIAKAIQKGRIHPQADTEQLYNELEQLVPKETQGYLTRVSGFFKQFSKSSGKTEL
jgi:membrane-bound lytic murein transglycosylase C